MTESVGGLDQIPWLNLMISYGLDLESLTRGDSTWSDNEMTRLVSRPLSDSTRPVGYNTAPQWWRQEFSYEGQRFPTEGPPLKKIDFVRTKLN